MLDADFLSIYHRDLYEMLDDNWERVVGLTAQLYDTQGSRLFKERNGFEYMDWNSRVLLSVEYYTRLNFYAETKDAQNGINQPKPMVPEGVEIEMDKPDEDREYTPEEVQAIYQDIYQDDAERFT